MKHKKDKPPKLPKEPKPPKEPKAKKLSLRDEMMGKWGDLMAKVIDQEHRLAAVEEKAGIAGPKGDKGETGMQGREGERGGGFWG